MYREKMFSAGELAWIRSRFFYVDRDHYGRDRLFFDNAGGSLRLKAAEEEFHRIDSIPDASEHSNAVAKELAKIEDEGREAIRRILFNAKGGTIYPSYTASQIAMEMIRVILENAKGTNVVITQLEHPSVYDAAAMYGSMHGMELRVAGVNQETGGVDTETILNLVDENTALLCCMAASNISGYIFETEKIAAGARKINPDIFIYVDAVQHAPHGALDPEKWGVDVVSFAPYKFFGVRGFGTAYLSDRVSGFTHHRLLGKPEDDWEIGSPATAQFAAVGEIIRYVSELGGKTTPGEKNARHLFEEGMRRIADHERGLLEMMLDGTGGVPGMREMPGVIVRMDGKDLTTRDLIMGVEFKNISCERASEEYDKRGVITFERSAGSIYSKRMVEAFGSKGMVRLSPLHVNTPEEISRFLQITQEIAAL
ncbi:MAG: aminotransferase class V-fold PLP-dependent enzyme [Lachnospiraceae bacterium]|nr:aminotransferase class V-fold PLP-dependent enzyme [Lachnospiraceae bacterium]